MATLDEALQAVTDETSVGDSLVALAANLKAQLDAVIPGVLTPEQQAKVDAIFSGVTANKDKYAAAVVANTPAA